MTRLTAQCPATATTSSLLSAVRLRQQGSTRSARKERTCFLLAKGRNPVHGFASNVQDLAARRDAVQFRALAKQAVRKASDIRHDMLAIIEHEERFLLA